MRASPACDPCRNSRSCGCEVTRSTMPAWRSSRRSPPWSGLTLEESQITDGGLAQLAGLPLEELGLFRCYSITDEGLRHLKHFPNLRQLTLRDLPITGAGLAALGELHQLALLKLNETGVGDAALKNLRGLKSLKRLELRQTRVGDAGLEILGTLSNLEYLDLGACRVTDAGLANLTGLARLQTLELKLNSGVTDAALDQLKKLKGLKTLGLAQTGMTEEAIQKLACGTAGVQNRNGIMIWAGPCGDRLLPLVLFHGRVNLGFHGIQVEAAPFLHGWILDGRNRQFLHLLLDEHKAPELEPELVPILIGPDASIRPAGALEGIQAEIDENRRVGMGLVADPAAGLINKAILEFVVFQSYRRVIPCSTSKSSRPSAADRWPDFLDDPRTGAVRQVCPSGVVVQATIENTGWWLGPFSFATS